MIFLVEGNELKEIFSDIGNYDLELYIKTIVKVKKDFSYCVLKNMNFTVMIDKKRLVIRGYLSIRGEKILDECIPLFYSGILYTGTRKKGFLSLEMSSYKNVKGYFFKDGVYEKNEKFDRCFSKIDLFQDIPDEKSIRWQYRWMKL